MNNRRPWWSCLVLAACVLGPAPAWGQQEEHEEALELIPVLLADDDEAMPELFSTWQWTVAANLQLDGLLDAELPDDRRKDSALRRARISGLLEWQYRWRLKIGVDLADSAPVVSRSSVLRDLSVEYRGDLLHAEFGLMVEPFGLLQSSSRGSAFAERPQSAGLGSGYGLGGAAGVASAHWALSGGLFGPTRNDVFFGGREDTAITLRATGLPLQRDDALLHLGFGLSLREPTDGFLQFVTIPETILLRGLDARSELLIADRYRLYAAEAAAQWGPVLLQGEFFRAAVGNALVARDLFENGGLTFVSPDYTGSYIEAVWSLTGERRSYSVRRGSFGPVHPRQALFAGGLGAVELAIRHGRIDLRDEAGGGERGLVSSLAVNWYPTDNLKLMLLGLDIEAQNAQGAVESVRAVQLRVQLHGSAP